MPKYKSHLIKSDETLANGSRVEGKVAFEPLNEAAKATYLAEEAAQLGKYVPSSPNERRLMERRLQETAYKTMFRQGKISKDMLDQSLRAIAIKFGDK